MCDTGASTQRVHAHLAQPQGVQKDHDPNPAGRGVTQLMGRPQMSHLVPELLAEGPEFQHGAPEGPGREPRGHAGPQPPRRRHRPPAQQHLRVAGEALQQQQQPVPTGKQPWSTGSRELELGQGGRTPPISQTKAVWDWCSRDSPGMDHFVEQPLPRGWD